MLLETMKETPPCITPNMEQLPKSMGKSHPTNFKGQISPLRRQEKFKSLHLLVFIASISKKYIHGRQS